MKTKFYLPLLLIAVTGIFISSCSVEKRKYTSGYFLDWKKSKPAVTKNESLKREVPVKGTTIQRSEISEVNPLGNEELITASTDNLNGVVIREIKPIVLDSVECDVIILKSGDEIKAKVTEVDQGEIKYKRCDNLDGPVYTLKKSEVFIIKYANGAKDIISPNDASSPTNKSETEKAKSKDSGTLGLLSFIFGILGLLIAAILFGPAAMVTGFLGMDSEKKNKGLAIAGFVLGVIDTIVAIAIIAAM